MSTFASSRKFVTDSPILAAAIYAGLLAVLLFAIVTSILDVVSQRGELSASSAMLEQLEGRRPPAGAAGDVTMPSGSAYLEGATVTVAGATLLQRVAGAAVKFGGNVLSTQLDLQGSQTKTGFLSMIASLEIEQPQLQQLLYDLEAGMPFLFVDQLVVQTPISDSGSATGNGKLRVLLGGLRAMAGCEMMRRVAMIGLASLALLLHGAAASTSSSDEALDVKLNGDLLNDDVRLAAPPTVSAMPAEPVTTVRVVAAPAAPARALSANPLWAVPLTQLSGTRDRPVFSRSRRPAAAVIASEPVVVAPPPRKIAIEPPRLALVGTIASDEEGFGIFIDQSTKATLRLKVGEDYQGWKLHAIRGREVTMEKDQQEAVLMLPQPGGAQSSDEVRLVPARALMRH